jgi:hypothetical protein
LVIALSCVAVSAVSAAPTASAVLVDGKNVSFDAYNIEDNNYFKLRDLAFILNGTEKQFSIGWDETSDSIVLTSGQPYVKAGGEMTGKGGGLKNATPTGSKILLNGLAVSFAAYNIDDNNYFRLRDVGAAFDFGVDWDEDRNTIVIDTSKSYTQAGANAHVGIWRIADTDEIDVFILNADNTIQFAIFYVGDIENNILAQGEYLYEDGLLNIYYHTVNGTAYESELSYTMEIDGNTAIIDGAPFAKVPLKDASAILNNPYDPYP